MEIISKELMETTRKKVEQLDLLNKVIPTVNSKNQVEVIKKYIIGHILGYNKIYKQKKLEPLSIRRLVSMCHPFDRVNIDKKLKQLKISY